MRSWILLAVLCATPLATIAAPPHAYAQPAYAQSEGIGSGEAAERVRALYGGRVISVSPANRGGVQGYTVRILVEGGRVKTVFVDSRGSIRGSD